MFVLLLSCFWLLIRASVSNTCKESGQVAFTFDQGPGPSTIKLLDILADLDVKVCFHINVDHFRNATYAEYIKRASLEGHTIGIFVPEQNLESESTLYDFIIKSSNWITSVTNKIPYYIRFGTKKQLTSSIRKSIEHLGFTITKAKLEIRDENNKIDSIWNSLGRGMIDSSPETNSFIFKQRDFIPNSVQSFDKIVDYVKEKGFKIVPIEKCVPITNKYAFNPLKYKK